MAGLHDLDVHLDVADGVRALAAGDTRLVALINGAVETTEHLLGRAGLRHAVSDLLSVEDAGIGKPAPGAYARGRSAAIGARWRSSPCTPGASTARRAPGCAPRGPTATRAPPPPTAAARTSLQPGIAARADQR